MSVRKKKGQLPADLKPAMDWFEGKGWEVFDFQRQAWEAFLLGQSGLINAPTGSGKTYAAFFGSALQYIRAGGRQTPGLRLLWITPLRALANEIRLSCQAAAESLGLNWTVAVRTGDTSATERARQKRQLPEMLITTPESLHLLLASKGYSEKLAMLDGVVCDEWHELVGSKRGVMLELALSRLRTLRPELKVWGISATIGNLDQAMEVLLGPHRAGRMIRAEIPKTYEVQTIFPDEVERFPWRGHLGIQLVEKVLPIIQSGTATLLFTNTRAQCEMWYRQLLEVDPSLAGQIAMHHGSLSREIRDWVEENLHLGKLKAVVCTSSLDLGVDFRPVETVVQVGGPKGVARFMQRAGRAGHSPGAVSRIFFLPTHALEIMEGAALRHAIQAGRIEARLPYLNSFDLLLQYLVTLACGEGFQPQQIWGEVKSTFAFQAMEESEWQWCLSFIQTGGESLSAYDDYKKVVIDENGTWRVAHSGIARRHRLSIGAIVSDATLHVEYEGGRHLGTIEEQFIAQLKPGDVFWFAGKNLEFIRMVEMTVQVRRSKAKNGKIPAWAGGRMPLSSELATEIRALIAQAALGEIHSPEMECITPILNLQQKRSRLPGSDELLIEYFHDNEGWHLLCYPFEGRSVHEGLSALMAWRLSRIQPLTFSIAVNDYGFELLSDMPVPVEEALRNGLFSLENLASDIQSGMNGVEMARRRFRDIAGIAGLVFKGFPGRQKKDRHLQAGSQLFFSTFMDYEPGNLLLQEAREEVLTFQLEEDRLRKALKRIAGSQIFLEKPAKATPFAFPIIVDRLRARLSSEKIEDRIARMKLKLEKD
jgi:ATP-dependent Lhr-like helicase